MGETYELLYPERRTVRREDIVGWYRDLVADGDLADDADGDVDAMAAALEDAGHITLRG